MDTHRTRPFDEIGPGMTGRFSKTLTDDDIRSFAAASGDENPLHLDDEYAKGTIFKERIGHGILTAGVISAAFARVLPGPGWIYVNQSLKFRAPVHVGDRVTAEVEVIRLVPERRFAVFRTTCSVGDRLVLEGEATLMGPARPGDG